VTNRVSVEIMTLKSVSVNLTPSKRRTDGRTNCPSVRPSVRVIDGGWQGRFANVLVVEIRRLSGF